MLRLVFVVSPQRLLEDPRVKALMELRSRVDSGLLNDLVVEPLPL